MCALCRDSNQPVSDSFNISGELVAGMLEKEGISHEVCTLCPLVNVSSIMQ